MGALRCPASLLTRPPDVIDQRDVEAPRERVVAAQERVRDEQRRDDAAVGGEAHVAVAARVRQRVRCEQPNMQKAGSVGMPYEPPPSYAHP